MRRFRAIFFYRSKTKNSKLKRLKHQLISTFMSALFYHQWEMGGFSITFFFRKVSIPNHKQKQRVYFYSTEYIFLNGLINFWGTNWITCEELALQKWIGSRNFDWNTFSLSNLLPLRFCAFILIYWTLTKSKRTFYEDDLFPIFSQNQRKLMSPIMWKLFCLKRKFTTNFYLTVVRYVSQNWVNATEKSTRLNIKLKCFSNLYTVWIVTTLTTGRARSFLLSLFLIHLFLCFGRLFRMFNRWYLFASVFVPVNFGLSSIGAIIVCSCRRVK